MAIDAYGNTLTSTSSSTATTTSSTATNPNGVLGKDAFLKLLLLELQNQDPTSPMDSEKILAQTSQLATLESSTNTNKALTDLSTALTSSMQYSGVSAIGKMADTGSNAVVLTTGQTTDFELNYPKDISKGTVNIMDVNGTVLRTLQVGATSAGTAKFSWDGKDNTGATLKDGTYYVDSSFTNTDNTSGTTRVGLYPIESIKFDSGKTYAKLGSSYVDFSTIKEISAN
ncbi:MAG: flagellar hook capping FlgD N-terminal domain-containing protein [Sulfuricurvum sp.]|nr:flagellar hook capping FlgD N-terminal domain-containing protein [Sulfuricurvum sp.]